MMPRTEVSKKNKYYISDDYSANPDRFVPISIDRFYKIRRAFFWHLSRIRK